MIVNEGDYVFDESSGDPLVNSMWIFQGTPPYTSTDQPHDDLTNWIEFEAPAGPEGPEGPEGPPGLLIDGSLNQTAYHDGTTWVPSSVMENQGDRIAISNPALPFGTSVLTTTAPFNGFGYEHTSGGIRMVSFAGSLGACWGTVTDDNMCIISNNLVRVFVEKTSGNVGIKEFNPAFDLHVNGTAGKPGGGLGGPCPRG